MRLSGALVKNIPAKIGQKMAFAGPHRHAFNLLTCDPPEGVVFVIKRHELFPIDERTERDRMPKRVIDRRVKRLDRAKSIKLARVEAGFFSQLTQRSLNIRFPHIHSAADELPGVAEIIVG